MEIHQPSPDPFTPGRKLLRSELPTAPTGYGWKSSGSKGWWHLIGMSGRMVIWACAADDKDDPRIRLGLMGTHGYWFDADEVPNAAHVLLALKAMGTDYSLNAFIRK